jgi:hypothetical protein
MGNIADVSSFFTFSLLPTCFRAPGDAFRGTLRVAEAGDASAHIITSRVRGAQER